MAWKFKNAIQSWELALKRGAADASNVSEYSYLGKKIPAIYGIGGSLIYFLDESMTNVSNKKTYENLGFETDPQAEIVSDKGFVSIDHLTNNVRQGELKLWSDFYKNIFGFTEVRYFDIRGSKTGLVSHALQSPCKTFCIPINKGTEGKSQINEYIEQYHGPGIQHLAFLTNDILKSLSMLKDTSIKTLSIDDTYYEEVFNRVPNVVEGHEDLKINQVLVDGDEDGYLLQIFTKNIIGPIFIEIIQRKNHNSFGEGNFGALFRSLEKDQEERGVL